MNIFPTQYSVLSARALKLFLSEQYDFVVDKCTLIVHNVSDTYLVEATNKKYIFKIYRDAHRSYDEIMGEVELLNFYINNGASVSYPVKDVSGNFLQSLNAAEGIRYGVMFSYAEGKPVYAMNDKQLKLVGIEMAKLHILSSKVTLKHKRKEYSIQSTLLNPIKVIKPAFVEMDEEYEVLCEIVNNTVSKMSKLDFSKFSYGYCQYDFLPKNFHFKGSEKLTFFDFDFSGKGYLINDIMSFYIHFFLEVYYKKMTREEADRCFTIFLEAYRLVKPVSDEEINSIKYFGLGFWIFYFGFHVENFDDWSNIFFTPNFIKSRIPLIQNWMEY
ncbi:phosphotransferase [Flavobacterium sp. NRK1]|uniref:phosphotransferase n=1 Tax=Flavobacterium sp. NRK1 TaxID=2954929 RepID=UPI002093AAAC|nr:phosphotransferase [Flavobacterium sp. NRK1]MCO6149237.1 phosphotransferase [Flavobacterium sp. NRK1]